MKANGQEANQKADPEPVAVGKRRPHYKAGGCKVRPERVTAAGAEKGASPAREAGAAGPSRSADGRETCALPPSKCTLGPQPEEMGGGRELQEPRTKTFRAGRTFHNIPKLETPQCPSTVG